jgi:hypothetical protein
MNIAELTEKLQVLGRKHAVSHFEKGNFLDSPNEEVQKYLDRNDFKTSNQAEFDHLFDSYCKGFQSYHVEKWTEGLSEDQAADLKSAFQPVGGGPLGGPEAVRLAAPASLDHGADVPRVKTAVEGFTKWWSGYCMDPTYPYSADEKEEHMKEAFVGGLSFAKQSYPDHSALLIEARDGLEMCVRCLQNSQPNGGHYGNLAAVHNTVIRDSSSTLSKLQSIKL